MNDLFKYPNGYFNFKNGKPLTNYEINKAINEGLDNIKKKIKNGIDNPSHSFATGNVLITIFAYKQKINKTKYTVYVNVSKGYELKVDIDIDLT